MSPSIASIVTPLSSPAVLSMPPSFPKSRDPVVSRCLASAHPPLFHAGGNALLLVLAQLFLRVELPAALRTLEQLHRYLLATSLRRRYFSVFGAGPLSFSASSTVTLSPFLTFWSADVGKCKSIRPSAVLTRSRPLSGVTLVTSPVIVWRPSSAASVAARVVDGCGGGFVGPCAIAKPASSRPAVVPASMAGSFMAFFLLCGVDHVVSGATHVPASASVRNDRKRERHAATPRNGSAFLLGGSCYGGRSYPVNPSPPTA